MATNPYDVETAEEDYESAQTDAENSQTAADTAITELENAIKENKTRTSYDENGHAYIEQWDPDLEGGGGWVRVKDFEDEYNLLQDLEDMSWDSMEDWAAKNATIDGGNLYDLYWEGMNDSAENMGVMTDADINNARKYGAQQLGFADWDAMNTAMKTMAESLMGGVSGQEGMSTKEMALYEDANRRNIRAMENDINRQLDAINANGSTMTYLAAADEARSQMSDARVAGEVSILQENFERQQVNYEYKQQMYGYMVETGNATQAQYLQALQADRVNSFMAYAQGMQTLQAQRQIDLQTQQAHADAIYNQINASLGISESAITQANELYVQGVQPYIDSMEAALVEADLDLKVLSQEFAEYSWTSQMSTQWEDENKKDTKKGIWGAFKAVAGVALSVVGVVAIVSTGGLGVGPGALLLGAGSYLTSSGEETFDESNVWW